MRAAPHSLSTLTSGFPEAIPLAGRLPFSKDCLRATEKRRKLRAVKISVIVPAFNEEKLIGETLRTIQEAMRAFARAGWETELVVCDNNSTDRTAELARAAGAVVVFEPVNQIARARNKGA